MKLIVLTQTGRVNDAGELKTNGNTFTALTEHNNIQDVLSQLSTTEFIMFETVSGTKFPWRCRDIISIRDADDD